MTIILLKPKDVESESIWSVRVTFLSVFKVYV